MLPSCRVAAAVGDHEQPFVADTAMRVAEGLAAQHVACVPPGAALALPDAVERALSSVTPLRPFLRWDPVPSPAIVPLRQYTEGESVRVLVVRSGVTQDPGSLEITVTPPSQYVASLGAFGTSSTANDTSRLRRRARCRLSLTACSTVRSARQSRPIISGFLVSPCWRTGRSWTLTSPTSTTLRRGSTSLGYASRLSRELPVRADHTAAARPDDPPAPGKSDHLLPGQYVVHDTPDLVLPYLPDPLARGVALSSKRSWSGALDSVPLRHRRLHSRVPRVVAGDSALPPRPRRRRAVREAHRSRHQRQLACR